MVMSQQGPDSLGGKLSREGAPASLNHDMTLGTRAKADYESLMPDLFCDHLG